MARGPQQGDRFGDWYLESRAKPIDGKRYWNAVNTVTDEKAVVPQTQLKALGEGRFHPSNEDFLHSLESGMSSSSAITTRVLLGNHKDDPFNLPDGVLPDDDDEFPFEPVFIEAPNIFSATEAFESDDDLSADEPDCCVADPNCTIIDGKHVVERDEDDVLTVDADGQYALVVDGKVDVVIEESTLRAVKAVVDEALQEPENPWEGDEDPLRKLVLDLMLQVDDVRTQVDRILKAVVAR